MEQTSERNNSVVKVSGKCGQSCGLAQNKNSTTISSVDNVVEVADSQGSASVTVGSKWLDLE